MEYFDLTLPLDADTLRYPDDPPVSMQTKSQTGLRFSEVAMALHSGTHVDAPAHFLSGGRMVLDYPLQRFRGPARVLDLSHVEDAQIDVQHLVDFDIKPRMHVLLKTRNSDLLEQADFDAGYQTLSLAAANLLAACQPLSIGFDYYSLDPPGSEAWPAHLVMAKANIPVYVCLRLQQVPAGRFQFEGMPLAFREAEASPVRALLWRES